MVALLVESCSSKLYPCPDISKIAVANLGGAMSAEGDSTQMDKPTVPIQNDFPIETSNTDLDEGSVPKVKNETVKEKDDSKFYDKAKIKDNHGLIKKKEPKRIHKVGKKNIFEKIIYAGKQQRKR